MSDFPDFKIPLLAAGVLALFGLYFWFVGVRLKNAIRVLADYFDGSAARKRAEIDHENKFGKPPLWLRAVRYVLIAMMLSLSAALVWNKFQVR